MQVTRTCEFPYGLNLPSLEIPACRSRAPTAAALEPDELPRRLPTAGKLSVSRRGSDGVVHAWLGQIVTFFAYRPPSGPQGSLTPTQAGRVTNPTQGHPEPPWEAPQAECWLLRREPKPPA